MSKLKEQVSTCAALGAAVLLTLVLFAGLFAPPARAAGTVGPSSVPGNNNGQFYPFVRLAPTWTDNLHFTAATAQTWTAPSGAQWVTFASTCNFWVNGQGAAAVVPSATVTDGTASTLSPTSFYLQPGVIALSVITNPTTTCDVTVDAYRRGP